MYCIVYDPPSVSGRCSVQEPKTWSSAKQKQEIIASNWVLFSNIFIFSYFLLISELCSVAVTRRRPPCEILQHDRARCVLSIEWEVINDGTAFSGVFNDATKRE